MNFLNEHMTSVGRAVGREVQVKPASCGNRRFVLPNDQIIMIEGKPFYLSGKGIVNPSEFYSEEITLVFLFDSGIELNKGYVGVRD